jgi:hypothetical protein
VRACVRARPVARSLAGGRAAVCPEALSGGAYRMRYDMHQPWSTPCHGPAASLSTPACPGRCSFHAALCSLCRRPSQVKRKGRGSSSRRVSPAYEQQMGDEGRTPLIRPGRPPVISRWRRRACRRQLARCTPSPLS